MLLFGFSNFNSSLRLSDRYRVERLTVTRLSYHFSISLWTAFYPLCARIRTHLAHDIYAVRAI